VLFFRMPGRCRGRKVSLRANVSEVLLNNTYFLATTVRYSNCESREITPAVCFVV